MRWSWAVLALVVWTVGSSCSQSHSKTDDAEDGAGEAGLRDDAGGSSGNGADTGSRADSGFAAGSSGPHPVEAGSPGSGGEDGRSNGGSAGGTRAGDGYGGDGGAGNGDAGDGDGGDGGAGNGDAGDGDGGDGGAGNGDAGDGGAGAGSGGQAAEDGAVARDFCSGEARVQYGGTLVEPVQVTTSTIVLAMGCCDGHVTVRFHTTEALGFDLCFSFFDNYPIGEFDVEEFSWGWAVVYVCDVDLQPSHGPMHGQPAVHAEQTLSGAGTFELPVDDQPFFITLCLTVAEAGQPLDGTRLHASRVPVAPDSWSQRFEMRLLSDTSMTSADVSETPLDQLELGDGFMNLLHIEYYDAQRHAIRWNSHWNDPGDLADVLPEVKPYGLPFVVLVGGERIYRGAFVEPISSILLDVPIIFLEPVASDPQPGFTIEASYPGGTPISGPDLRGDVRIFEALEEAGKLVW